MNIGLLYTPVSIYQMTRGALVLFVGILSVLFLGRKLFPHQWFALTVVVLGVAVVGLSGTMTKQALAEKGDGERTSGFVQVLTKREEGEPSDGTAVIIGVFFILFAQIGCDAISCPPVYTSLTSFWSQNCDSICFRREDNGHVLCHSASCRRLRGLFRSRYPSSPVPRFLLLQGPFSLLRSTSRLPSDDQQPSCFGKRVCHSHFHRSVLFSISLGWLDSLSRNRLLQLLRHVRDAARKCHPAQHYRYL